MISTDPWLKISDRWAAVRVKPLVTRVSWPGPPRTSSAVWASVTVKVVPVGLVLSMTVPALTDLPDRSRLDSAVRSSPLPLILVKLARLLASASKITPEPKERYCTLVRLTPDRLYSAPTGPDSV